MPIQEHEKLGRRVNPDQSGEYEWKSYCKIWINNVGHHKPTIGQCNAAGWMREIPTDYDPSIQKLSDRTDNGVIITRKIVDLNDEEIQLYKNKLISYTKLIAYDKIVAIIPEWKQRNKTARATELQEIRHEAGVLTVDEQEELNNIRSIFEDQVTPIRAASDLIEIEINDGKISTEEEIENHILWP